MIKTEGNIVLRATPDENFETLKLKDLRAIVERADEFGLDDNAPVFAENDFTIVVSQHAGNAVPIECGECAPFIDNKDVILEMHDEHWSPSHE